MFTNDGAIRAWLNFDEVGFFSGDKQEIATYFVKGYLINGLRRHAANIPSGHLVMSSIQNAEVDLN